MPKRFHTIEVVSHRHRLRAENGQNLMEALAENSIFLRSDCGGRGICGKCLIELIDPDGRYNSTEACTCTIMNDLSLRVPDTSLMSVYSIDKAQTSLPHSFVSRFSQYQTNSELYGLAVDLGTTTIALYLCDLQRGRIESSIVLKNPQSLFGDDVMSRIGVIGQSEEQLTKFQQLVVRVIEWGSKELSESLHKKQSTFSQMVIVGNPTMIHILMGVSPSTIGSAPFKPQFLESRRCEASALGFNLPGVEVETLPQISGFLGADILAAAMAVELEKEPVGTLLIDLGTNGELLLKGKDSFYATSCATGPAFEGASLSCGMQAIPSAIDRIKIGDATRYPDYSVIHKQGTPAPKPAGICGSGIISAVASLWKSGLIEKSGLFSKQQSCRPLENDARNQRKFVIVPSREAEDREISITQKDIRVVQLGKAALITGIEFLLKSAAIEAPAKIIIAGAFGSFLDKHDLQTLGMIPPVAPEVITVAGNAAGTGAIMSLCDPSYREKASRLAGRISVIELAGNQDFQNAFINNLNFT